MTNTSRACPRCQGTGLADVTQLTKSRECSYCGGSGVASLQMTTYDFVPTRFREPVIAITKPTDWARVAMLVFSALLAVSALWEPQRLAFAVGLLITAYLPSKASP